MSDLLNDTWTALLAARKALAVARLAGNPAAIADAARARARATTEYTAARRARPDVYALAAERMERRALEGA